MKKEIDNKQVTLVVFNKAFHTLDSKIDAVDKRLSAKIDTLEEKTNNIGITW